jgi:hypothetical protein
VVSGWDRINCPYLTTSGDYDGYSIIEVPDDVAFASGLLKAASGGAFKTLSTKLISVDDTLEAFRRAGELQYRPPARPRRPQDRRASAYPAGSRTNADQSLYMTAKVESLSITASHNGGDARDGGIDCRSRSRGETRIPVCLCP